MNSEYSFSYTSCLTKAEEPSPPYYLPIAGGRIIGFIPFPRVLLLCEMQSVSSRIWTCVVMSISYNDNHYITGVLYLCRGCNQCILSSADKVISYYKALYFFKCPLHRQFIPLRWIFCLEWKNHVKLGWRVWKMLHFHNLVFC